VLSFTGIECPIFLLIHAWALQYAACDEADSVVISGWYLGRNQLLCGRDETAQCSIK